MESFHDIRFSDVVEFRAVSELSEKRVSILRFLHVCAEV